MRVLLNTKPLIFRKSGIGYYISNILNALRQEGVDVVPTVEEGSRKMIGVLGAASARLREIFGSRYPSFVKPLGDRLISYVSGRRFATEGFDIYHETGLERMPGLHAGKVANLYDLSFVRFPELLPAGLARAARQEMAGNLADADRVIVNTSFIRQEAVEILGVPPGKVDVIPLAPSAGYHKTDRPAARRRISNITSGEYVLYAGTIEPRKNITTLIRAFSQVPSGREMSLVLAGGFGWKYKEILACPAELKIRDRVIFTGYVDEERMNDLYNCATVVVYPSLYEGFGLPPLEAMSCGAPVIISDIPPLLEVSGGAALSFSPLDDEELAHRIESVVARAGLREDLSIRGLKRASEFSWQRAARETIRTYERALGS